MLEGGDIIYDYLDGTDSLGLDLDSLGVASIRDVVDSLEFITDSSSVLIQYNSEVLATVYNNAIGNFTVEDFVGI